MLLEPEAFAYLVLNDMLSLGYIHIDNGDKYHESVEYLSRAVADLIDSTIKSKTQEYDQCLAQITETISIRLAEQSRLASRPTKSESTTTPSSHTESQK